MEENALVVKGEADQRLAAYGDMMDGERVSANDVLMPVMRLMQPGSSLVASEKAKPGEWRGTLSENLLAPKADSVEVICFGFHKTWVVYRKPPGGKREFVKVEPYTVRTRREREETIDGVLYQNFETINYVVVPVGEALSGTMIPYLVRLNSSAYMAGKKMESYRLKLELAKKPHCFSTFKVGSVFKETEKGKYYVPTIEWGRDTSAEELTAIRPWLELAKAGRAKADDQDLARETHDEETPPPPSAPPPGVDGDVKRDDF